MPHLPTTSVRNLDAEVHVNEGGRRGLRVHVKLPRAASVSVPAVERELSPYLFEADVAVV
jgi:hypothetical protein